MSVPARTKLPLPIWQTLLSPESQPLRDLAAKTNPQEVAAITKLRKLITNTTSNTNSLAQTDPQHADLTHAALDLAAARRKLQPKLCPPSFTTIHTLLHNLAADTEAAEMASSLAAATHKASRFQSACPNTPITIADLCCGLGIDALGFALSGLNVYAVDANETRAFLASHNLSLLATTFPKNTLTATWADATGESKRIAASTTTPLFAHIDPARRNDGQRVRPGSLDDLAPSTTDLQSILSAIPNATIKLAPGIDIALAREALTNPTQPLPIEFEFISEDGRLTQALAHTGTLAGSPTRRRATVLSRQLLYSATPNPPASTSPSTAATLFSDQPPQPAPLSDPKRFLFEPDDSIERAQLLAELCALTGCTMPHPEVGLLTRDELPTTDSQLLAFTRAFELLETLPFHEKKLESRLVALKATTTEIKTRGKAIDPDLLQPALNKALKAALPKSAAGTPSNPFTTFVLRFGNEKRALITKRL